MSIEDYMEDGKDDVKAEVIKWAQEEMRETESEDVEEVLKSFIEFVQRL